MGRMSQRRIEEFQERYGITPASGERLELLLQMQRKAFDLIRVIELEVSGIRDGDGYWSGSDGMGGTAQILRERIDKWLAPEYRDDIACPRCGGQGEHDPLCQARNITPT